VVAPTPYNLEVALAVRKDWPELAVILDKALAHISPEERSQLAEAAGVSTRVAFAETDGSITELLSNQEKLILAGLIAGGIGVLALLGWAIRRQKKPVFRSLQGKSVLFLAMVFFLVGGVTVWVLEFIGDRISGQLGSYVAERHVLWHKEKVLGAVQRELALAKQMADSEILQRWAVDESNPNTAADARDELQRYHDNFRAKSYFVGLAKSKHFFYADNKVKRVALNVVDTLSADDEDDIWFFATMADKAAYNLNVDHNVQLGVTNLWVNYAMRRDDKTHGVVGTGVRLTEFVTDFITQDTKGVGAMMIDDGGAIQAHVDSTKITQNALAKDSAEEAGIWALLSSEQDRKQLRQYMTEMKSGLRDTKSFFINIEGKHSLVAMAYLEPLKWYTIAVFEPGAMVGLQEMGALAAVLGIALLVTVIVFVFGQNILIIRPLDQLTMGANRMADGDYDVRIPVTQRDEIGHLTQTFNDMSSTISDYTRNLETKVEDRTRELSEAYEVIQDSIQYASRIQRSILPSEKFLAEDLSDHFILWEPRDVVGGDLYWYRRVQGGFIIAVGDCTGHGVPGAFLTMIASGALDRALREFPTGEPGAILQIMNRSIQISLGQDQNEGESDDGLELGICRINTDRTAMRFAGSRFSLFSLENGEIVEIKGTKKGVGYRNIDAEQKYEEVEVPLKAGVPFYMTSDGIIDQIGGERRRSFGKKRFKQLLLSIQDQPMSQQKDIIYKTFIDYQGSEKRRDDVSAVGFVV